MTPLQAAIDAATIEASARFEPEAASLEFVFAPDFLGFAGHFPDAPVLPAAVQLMLGRRVLERWSGKACRLKGVSQAKFFKPITPQARVLATCRPLPSEPGALRAQVELRLWEDGHEQGRAAVFTFDLEHCA